MNDSFQTLFKRGKLLAEVSISEGVVRLEVVPEKINNQDVVAKLERYLLCALKVYFSAVVCFAERELWASEEARAVECIPYVGSRFGFPVQVKQFFHFFMVGELIRDMSGEDKALLSINWPLQVIV